MKQAIPFSRYQASQELSQWKIIIVTVFSTVLVSSLIVKFLMPTPMLPLTEQQMQVYELGKTFSGVWPTLSKEKQKWFLNTAAEKGRLTQNSVEGFVLSGAYFPVNIAPLCLITLFASKAQRGDGDYIFPSVIHPC